MTTDATGVMYLTRRETFSAAHRLWSEQMSAEDNERLFGVCARPFGHGHNYVIEVTVKGRIDPASGIVINLVEVQAAIQDLIIRHVDHRHLNHDSPLCAGVNPTCENLGSLFWHTLHERFGDLMHQLRLYETEDNYVTFRG